MQGLLVCLRRVLAPLVAIVGSCLVFSAGGCGGSASGPAFSAACGDLFDVSYSANCDPSRPASEIARDRGRFLTLCEAELTLPGVVVSTSQVESCVNALTSAGICLVDANTAPVTPSECQILNVGSLGGGAACSSGSQCQSGDCSLASDGGAASAVCGSCTVPIAIGQPCGNGAGSDCAMGGVCSDTPMICQAVVYGGVGATCGTAALLCGDGLYCDPTTELCANAKPAGSACTLQQGECASALVCLTTTNACGNPGTSGASCMSIADCAQGFDCGPMNQCVAVTYAAAGQPCGGTVHCLVGSCTGDGASSVCPSIIPDGQSCPSALTPIDAGAFPTTCDIFASCKNGVCTLTPPTCN